MSTADGYIVEDHLAIHPIHTIIFVPLFPSLTCTIFPDDFFFEAILNIKTRPGKT